MATGSASNVEFLLVHGKNKYDLKLSLSAEEQGDVLTVGHLQRLVARETGIPPNGQRLILKGVQLSNPLDKLNKYALLSAPQKEKPKLLLIGEKPPSKNDETRQQFAAFSDEISRHEKKMSDMSIELDSANRGFLNDAQLSTLLTELKRRLRNERVLFEKLLERIDAVAIPESGDDQEVYARSTRKQLVVRVQQLEDRAKQFESTLGEVLTLVSKRKK